MSKYEIVDESVEELLREVRAEFFPELRNAKIKCLFSLKKRQRGGKIILATIQKTNDLIKCLVSENGVELDYVIIIDKVAWDNTEKIDRTRLIRHELRHVLYDDESDKNPYKIQDHDIEDFLDEVSLNKDDERWATRVCSLVAEIYEQMKDEEGEEE